MAVHSSILAWRIPWTEETGVLQSTGSHRVTRLSNLACTLNPNVNVGAASVCSPLPTPFPSLPASQSGNSILLTCYAEGSPLWPLSVSSGPGIVRLPLKSTKTEAQISSRCYSTDCILDLSFSVVSNSLRPHAGRAPLSMELFR